MKPGTCGVWSAWRHADDTLKQGVMLSPVEAWWVGLYARVFDKLRLMFLIPSPREGRVGEV